MSFASVANDYIIDVHTANGWTCVLWDSGYESWSLACSFGLFCLYLLEQEVFFVAMTSQDSFSGS